MKHLIATAGLVALTACSQPGEVYRSLHTKPARWSTTETFGNANMNNHLVMTGEKATCSICPNRFAKEVDSARSTLPSTRHNSTLARAIRFASRRTGSSNSPRCVSGSTVIPTKSAQAPTTSAWPAPGQCGRELSCVARHQRNRLEAVVSFGETQPLIVTQGRERRNRRTVTEVSGFVRRIPS